MTSVTRSPAIRSAEPGQKVGTARAKVEYPQASKSCETMGMFRLVYDMGSRGIFHDIKVLGGPWNMGGVLM